MRASSLALAQRANFEARTKCYEALIASNSEHIATHAYFPELGQEVKLWSTDAKSELS